MTTKLARDLVPGDRLPRIFAPSVEVLSVRPTGETRVSKRGQVEQVIEIEARDLTRRGSYFWDEERPVSVEDQP